MCEKQSRESSLTCSWYYVYNYIQSHFSWPAENVSILSSSHIIRLQSIAAPQRSLWQSRTEIPIGDSDFPSTVCVTTTTVVRHYRRVDAAFSFFLFVCVLVFFRHDTESRRGVKANDKRRRMSFILFFLFFFLICW